MLETIRTHKTNFRGSYFPNVDLWNEEKGRPVGIYSPRPFRWDRRKEAQVMGD
jgi:hypothetical protein